MKLLVVGTPEDVTGFALAGVEGVVCTNRDEARQAIANADADTLVLVSAEHAVPRVPRVPRGSSEGTIRAEELRGTPRNSEALNVVALPARM